MYSVKKKKFFRNIVYAFGSQFIAMILSATMSLLMPKLMGVKEFSYWQLFLFYTTYTGFFHFGLNDGIYLREGGKKYEELEFNVLGSQFRISILFQCFFCFIIILATLQMDIEKPRMFVLAVTGMYLIVFNASYYLGYIFQAVNETKVFSVSVIISKLSFLIVVILLILKHIQSFEIYTLFYVITQALSLFYCIYKGKQIVFAKASPVKKTFQEIKKNIAVGNKLMFATIASMLILGMSRVIVDYAWGIKTFGKFSFSLSLTNLFLLFINQLSMVLYPMLRQCGEDSRYRFYCVIRSLLGIMLPCLLVFYIPIKSILSIWLPNYRDSMYYLGFLLPICTFDGKMNLLCNTFFKVLRKEKELLKINILTMAFSTIATAAGVYIWESLVAVLVLTVCVFAFRNIIAELYLSKIMRVNLIKKILLELGFVIIYLVGIILLSSRQAFLMLIMVYGLYLAINWKTLISTTQEIKALR